MSSLTPSKDPGEILTTVEKSVLTALPQKFLVGASLTVTRQRDPLETTLSSISGSLVSSKLQQDVTTELWKINSTLSGLASSMTTSVVDGSTFGTLGSITESLNFGSLTASTGIDVISSDATELGGGWFSKETKTAPFSTTTIALTSFGERGYGASLGRTWTAPSATPATEALGVHVDRTLESIDRARQDVLTFTNTARPLLTKEFNRFGGMNVATDSYVPPSTTPTNSGTTIQKLVQEREKEARLISLVIATGQIVSTVDKVDNVPGSKATTEYYLVLASSTIPTDTSVITYEWLEFPENPLLRIEKKVTYTIPADYEETRDQGFHFATLFESYYSDNLQGTTVFQRGGWSDNVPHRIVHHFGTTKLVPAKYQIIEEDLLVFSVPVHGLTDGVTFERTTDGVLYTQVRGATTPTQAAYVALIGSEVIAGGDSVIWHAGIFRTTTAYVTLQ